MRKEVGVQVAIRDQTTGEVAGENACPGWTEDDGATVTMGLGNIPQIYTALAGDVRLTVFQPSVIYEPAVVIGVTDDIENGVMTIQFDIE